jgi:membrane protein implicated in regulation of membrane protease activity
MELLLAPEAQPFAIAALILFGLMVVELAGMLIGHPMSQWFDHAADSHGDGPGSTFGALDWLNAGRVPILILILLALGSFSLIGFAMTAVAREIAVPFPAVLFSVLALAATLPVVRTTSRWISRIIPRDETYAVDEAEFIGRTAEVTMGPLDTGLPGRVKLRDAHGNWHFPRARAAKGHGPMAVGANVLLVDRDGSTFLAIPAPDDLLNR